MGRQCYVGILRGFLTYQSLNASRNLATNALTLNGKNQKVPALGRKFIVIRNYRIQLTFKGELSFDQHRVETEFIEFYQIYIYSIHSTICQMQILSNIIQMSIKYEIQKRKINLLVV